MGSPLLEAHGADRLVPAMAVSGTLSCSAKAARAAYARDGRPIRLLVFTSLYPNAVQPRHGVFVEERLRKLVATGRVSATVVAPVPWFPFTHPRFGTYATFARVPEQEERYGIQVVHPRYPVIPKIGMNIAPLLVARATLPVVRKLGADCDLIDAHYFYPDGVAAVRMGRAVDKPVVVTARGTDVNVIAGYRRPRLQICKAAAHAAAVVAVSRALKEKLVILGVDPGKITCLRNGVDLDFFRPCGRNEIRARLALEGARPVWLIVGHLIESKGVHIAIDALARVPDTTLLIVGDGPEEHRLRSQVQGLDLVARVRFVGSLAHDALCEYYNAADALIHPSSREGMPNVVLEALACGTPVIAAPFDGVAELLNAPEAGEIATERSAAAVAMAWRRLRDRAPARASTRRVAEALGWQPVVEAQQRLYVDVLSAWHGRVRTGAAS